MEYLPALPGHMRSLSLSLNLNFTKYAYICNN
jgi:hypothetical protein